MKQTILYVDTDETRISRVLDIIESVLGHNDVIHVSSLVEAYKVLLERTVDVFIVNISSDTSRVSNVEGLRFVAAVREIPRYILAPVIIFSSWQDPQLYAYERLNCLGYLSKTFPAVKLADLLKKASLYRTKRPADATIVFGRNRSIYPVMIKDIVYMIRENGATSVHMANGEVLRMPYVRYSRILSEVDGNGLFRCNRSTIVNRDYVYAVDSTNCFVVLRDGMGMLDVGLKYRTEINENFSNQYNVCDGQKKYKKREEYNE